ncbi:MAG TPA: HAD hydrolase-like protein [Victivallales bacterium]|nr:HAD hydrolase-like protein [Victivallales bacterium]
MNKFIALDLGNVCINIKFENCLEALSECDSCKLSDIKDLYLKQEIGVIDTKTFLDSLVALTGFEREKVIKLFCSIIEEEIPGVSDIMNKLTDKGYKIAFLSDTSELHLNESRRKLSFAHLVIGGVYSFEVGHLKPDVSMYREFEKKYGKPAMYIDDKEVNCIGAEKIGWPVHRFTSADKLKAAVDKLINLK